MSFVSRHLIHAESKKAILHTTLVNALEIYNSHDTPDWAKESIAELALNQQWRELNDRFHSKLTFGTGGIRGRTIGRIITAAENGTPTDSGRPQHPAVGTNMMNEYNLKRAVKGLCSYLWKNFTPTEAIPRPRIIFAHDTRHFSREFAEMAARDSQRMGLDVWLFDSERPTPELSFALRHLRAHAGAVVTASHNPAHDNGFKVYYSDGAQIVEPHASGIIAEVEASPHGLDEDISRSPGEYHIPGAELDDLYIKQLRTLILDIPMIQAQREKLKVVFTPLHGTGAVFIPRILTDLGVTHSVVPSQARPDGRFPTVKSPNPEYSESLFLAMQQAEAEGASLVVATDPDTDRMGVAVRNDEGRLVLLNGNQIASLIAFYRLNKLFDTGVLNAGNAREHAAIIKTVVTTDLLKEIAGHFGVKCVETLTGFKYIAEKLGNYEAQVCEAKELSAEEYRNLNEKARRDLLLKYSTYYVFGGEESYGYSASDFVRDKDANAAVVMFCETAAFALAHGWTLTAMLDDIQARLGVHQEMLGQLTLEGAEGSEKIKQLKDSYSRNPPESLGGRKVVKTQRYDQEDIRDADGKLLPKELMHMFHLEDGGRVAVRGSGTEPKIKYYLFGVRKPAAGEVFTPAQVARLRDELTRLLAETWEQIEKDAKARMQ
ncbi:phospho-sugar mutase [Oscillatoria amoena NRMC-F 0135]|nr:phospho-sugar mutase [Oscillatoria laete-virens]MDL5050290.1 phospho-sugar mutase [Oscillatoria amoena NRMC-F 0135]MDL5055123.1 phospho-sugar mutase [Oscillatoria laete-virens NRMC-F 0139]